MQEVSHVTLAAVDGYTCIVVDNVSSGSLMASRHNCELISWHPSKPIVALRCREQGNEHLLMWDCMADQVIYRVLGEYFQPHGDKAWSPDGQWLACQCPAYGGNSMLTCVQILQAATGQPQVRTSLPGRTDLCICYSSDSSKVVVSRVDKCGWDVLDIPSASNLHSQHYEKKILWASARGAVFMPQ